MDRKEIKELISDLEASKLKKLVIKRGDFELHLEKEGDAPAAPVHYQVPRHQPAEVPHEAPQKNAPKKVELDGAFVKSPMVGTFYASPSPEQPPFVKVGDQVSENTIVCIIEAMKVMNEVKAGVKGTIAEIMTDNGQPVEFGSKLLRIV